MNNKETMLLIPVHVTQAIMNYLASKPWGEVKDVMPILQSLRPAQEKSVAEVSAEG
jgi:hypothetical protein